MAYSGMYQLPPNSQPSSAGGGVGGAGVWNQYQLPPPGIMNMIQGLPGTNLDIFHFSFLWSPFYKINMPQLCTRFVNCISNRNFDLNYLGAPIKVKRSVDEKEENQDEIPQSIAKFLDQFQNVAETAKD